MKSHYIQFILILFLMNYNIEIYAQGTEGKKEVMQEIDAAGKYNMLCAVCHGKDGKLNVNGASDLSKSKLSKKGRIKIISKGKGLMIPFKSILKEEEIKAISKYLDELIEK